MLTHPEVVRRFSDPPPLDVVTAAFGPTLETGVSSAEVEKLETWRRAVRREAGGEDEA